jgi:hypothetical protein
MSGANEGPDKRTTAYENIFGRPTAKPKGPNNAYPIAPSAPSMAPVNQWVNQNAYIAGQQAPRYNGNMPPIAQSHSYRGPQQMYGYGPPQGLVPQQQPDIDRRISTGQPMIMNDPRMSGQPGASNNNVASAADAYGGTSDHGGFYPQPTPYARASSSTSAAPPHSRPLPSIQGQYTEPQSYRQPSNAQLPPYARQPSTADPFPPPDLSPPANTAPRLPSFDLGGSKRGNEDLWFSNGNSNGHGAGSNGVPAVSPPMAHEEGPISPGAQSSTLYSESADREDSALGDEGMYRNGMSTSSDLEVT